MLTTEERNHIEVAFMRGPAALLEEGWNPDMIQQFFDRADVRIEVEELIKEFRGKDAHEARLKYGLKRQLSRLGQGATAILGAALAGPIYARDQESNIIMDAKGHPVLREIGPTRNQLVAATEILDRVGVAPANRLTQGVGGSTGQIQINLTVGGDERLKIDIADDPTHTTVEEKALSRERCRNVIEVLSKKLPKFRETARKALPFKKKKASVKKKKGKRVKKKVKVT